MKWLGIDYGEARVGVAESFGTLAEPVGVLQNTETLIAEIASLCRAKRVDHIVVGISEREMAEHSRAFAQKLEAELGISTSLEDETLSTREIEQRVGRRAAGSRRPRGPLDHWAAAIILERALEQLRPEDL